MKYFLVLVHYEDDQREGILLDNERDAKHALKGNQNPCSVLADAFYENVIVDLDTDIKVSTHSSDEIDDLILKLKPAKQSKKIK